ITIYQHRDFSEPGTKGCKGCAGILSMSLLKNLEELNLSVPREIVQSKIEHYAVHSPYASISMSNPEKDVEIISVYRGNGPRVSSYDNQVSFDGWLLREAQNRGAKVENREVSAIWLEGGASVETADGREEYDLVVLAGGVNAKPVTFHGHNYLPPKTAVLSQNELHAGSSQVDTRLGNTAHAFLLPKSGLLFGTLVPKGPFINVSLLNIADSSDRVNDFLNQGTVKNVMPKNYQRACNCRPEVPVTSGRNYFGDRFVAIGDAAVTRLYKDGIGSGLLTARRAALTALNQGISGRDFKHYYLPFCKNIDRDNRWGKLLFKMNDIFKDSRICLLAQSRLIAGEQDNVSGPQPFTRSAWGMFSGSYSYKSMAMMSLNPVSMGRFFLAVSREIAATLFHKRTTEHKRIHVGGRKVLILGSGFGGTYTLRHLVRSLNRNENVETTMVSDENFFLFSPLLHEVAMGSIETRHIAYPIRRLHWRDRFNFIQARLVEVDIKARKVITTAGELDFDYLILALGSITDMSKLNTMAENVFTLKTLRDSMLIRNHIIGVFEKASIEDNPETQRQLLTFIVSGAGYTGVQLMTEMRDFIYHHLLRFYKTINPDNIRIILVEKEPKIVAELHTKLGAYVMKQLHRMGIEVRLRSQITRIWNEGVEINGKETVPSSTLIWVAGVVANPVIAAMDVKKDNTGRVRVNEYMEVPGHHGVYAVGDCAHFRDPVSGRPVPPRAHIAVRQAKVAARNILAEIRGGEKKAYKYADTMEIISLGTSKAVFRFYGLRLYGFLARLIWIGSYSMMVTGTYNRLRIVGDWLLSLVFGRDTTFIKLNK
ncbi:MAG: FAD-dependent oxidoreductase, partial [Dehalococcoidales bacterium]